MAKEIQCEDLQAEAALRMGLALRLEVRANVRGRAAGAPELPGPHASASMRQAAGASPALEVCAAVEIYSLQKSPELNGVRGEAVKWQDLGTGRCQVTTRSSFVGVGASGRSSARGGNAA